VAGSQVDVISDTKRDLVAAAGTLSIKGKVERSLMAAGGNIVVSSPEIGATARIAGGSVDISGTTFKEDLFVAGGNVSLKNVTIEGDLAIGTGKLSIIDSVIKGNFYGGYDNVEGDLSKQVLGKVVATQNQVEVKPQPTPFSNINLAWEINIIIFLIFLVLILLKTEKFETETRFNKNFGWDFLIGLLILVLPVIALIISAFVYLLPVTAIIVFALYLSSVLTVIYTPIYIANLVKNTFKINLQLYWLTIISYFSLLVLNLLSFYIPLLGFISFVFWLTSLGYLAKKEYKLIRNSLYKK